MQPSRRTTVRTAATATLALTAGCSTRGLQSGPDSTPETTGTTDDDGFETRLRGPGTDRHLFDAGDVASVGSLRSRRGTHQLPVVLSEAAAGEVASTFRSAGVTDDHDEFSVVQRSPDGEARRFGVSGGLAAEVASGDWDGRLVLTFEERARARDVRDVLSGTDGTAT